MEDEPKRQSSLFQKFAAYAQRLATELEPSPLADSGAHVLEVALRLIRRQSHSAAHDASDSVALPPTRDQLVVNDVSIAQAQFDRLTEIAKTIPKRWDPSIPNVVISSAVALLLDFAAHIGKMRVASSSRSNNGLDVFGAPWATFASELRARLRGFCASGCAVVLSRRYQWPPHSDVALAVAAEDATDERVSDRSSLVDLTTCMLLLQHWPVQTEIASCPASASVLPSLWTIQLLCQPIVSKLRASMLPVTAGAKGPPEYTLDQLTAWADTASVKSTGALLALIIDPARIYRWIWDMAVSSKSKVAGATRAPTAQTDTSGLYSAIIAALRGFLLRSSGCADVQHSSLPVDFDLHSLVVTQLVAEMARVLAPVIRPAFLLQWVSNSCFPDPSVASAVQSFPIANSAYAGSSDKVAIVRDASTTDEPANYRLVVSSLSSASAAVFSLPRMLLSQASAAADARDTLEAALPADAAPTARNERSARSEMHFEASATIPDSESMGSANARASNCQEAPHQSKAIAVALSIADALDLLLRPPTFDVRKVVDCDAGDARAVANASDRVSTARYDLDNSDRGLLSTRPSLIQSVGALILSLPPSSRLRAWSDYCNRVSDAAMQLDCAWAQQWALEQQCQDGTRARAAAADISESALEFLWHASQGRIRVNGASSTWFGAMASTFGSFDATLASSVRTPGNLYLSSAAPPAAADSAAAISCTWLPPAAWAVATAVQLLGRVPSILAALLRIMDRNETRLPGEGADAGGSYCADADLADIAAEAATVFQTNALQASLIASPATTALAYRPLSEPLTLSEEAFAVALPPLFTFTHAVAAGMLETLAYSLEAADIGPVPGASDRQEMPPAVSVGGGTLQAEASNAATPTVEASLIRSAAQKATASAESHSVAAIDSAAMAPPQRKRDLLASAARGATAWLVSSTGRAARSAGASLGAAGGPAASLLSRLAGAARAAGTSHASALMRNVNSVVSSSVAMAKLTTARLAEDVAHARTRHRLGRVLEHRSGSRPLLLSRQRETAGGASLSPSGGGAGANASDNDDHDNDSETPATAAAAGSAISLEDEMEAVAEAGLTGAVVSACERVAAAALLQRGDVCYVQPPLANSESMQLHVCEIAERIACAVISISEAGQEGRTSVVAAASSAASLRSVWGLLGAVDALLWGILHESGALARQPPQGGGVKSGALAAVTATAGGPAALQRPRIRIPAAALMRATQPLSSLRALLVDSLVAAMSAVCTHALVPSLRLLLGTRAAVGGAGTAAAGRSALDDADIGVCIAEGTAATLGGQLARVFSMAPAAASAGAPSTAVEDVAAGLLFELCRISGLGQRDGDADEAPPQRRLRAALCALVAQCKAGSTSRN